MTIGLGSLTSLGLSVVNSTDVPLISGSLLLCTCYSVLSHARPFATPWAIARQTPLSMGSLQARVLEWDAVPSSRGSSQPRDRTQVSHVAGRFFIF